MSEPEFRPGLADVPVAESAISFIDGKRARLEYRGIAVEALARESTFEETAWLLLKGALPTQRELVLFDRDLKQNRSLKYRQIDILKCLPPSGHPMEALQASLAALGMFFPAKEDAWESTLHLVAKTTTLVAAFHRVRHGEDALAPREDLGHAANFFYMLTGKEPSAPVARVLDACLILHAEHTMNASTFAARVVGSTQANPYSVISAAVGALSGPLHGGANEEVLEMLDEIGDHSKAKAWLDDAIATKKKIMGFGHRVYKVKDPRATVLQELAEHVFTETGRPAAYETSLSLEAAANTLLGPKGIYPNVDFFSGIVYSSLGIPRDLFTPMFAMSRVVGWLSHWTEQMRHNRIFRPEQVFTGQRDQPFIPLEQRP